MNNNMRKKFFDAYAELDENDETFLENFARRCIRGTSFSCVDDVLNEAIVRICDGKRIWPSDVDLAVFMIGCIRSICSNARKLKDFGHSDIDDLVVLPPPLITKSTEDIVLERERLAITKKAVAFARATLQGDQQSLQILEGMVAGLQAKEMKEAFGIDDAAFRAARQRVVKRLRVYAGRRRCMEE